MPFLALAHCGRLKRRERAMEAISKHKDILSIVIAILTIVGMFYKMANFITMVDARLMVLESTSKDMKKDLHTIVQEQARSISATTTELKVFEAQTNQRLDFLESSIGRSRKSQNPQLRE